jgi:DNA topoisomerase-1
MRTLVVAEKFNTALRIAVVLSDGRMQRSRVDGVNVFRFDRPEGPYAVVGLRGHIVELDYPEEHSSWSLEGLPRLLEAQPLKRVTETKIVDALQGMVREFDRVILATDFDREGELIGLECLELLQKVHPGIEVKRARYSALTREEIEQSFQHLHELDRALAEAAGARQEIDLVWGALLTRYLTLSSEQRGHGFLSVGRVQTPTLALLVERDQEIKQFQPKPYWTIVAQAEHGGVSFTLSHAHGIFAEEERALAAATFAKVKGATKGTVQRFVEEETHRRPPVPFSTTLFVAEATRLGVGAAQAMRIAEDLYTQGLISYPRTDNTVYPRGAGLRSIAERFRESPFKAEAEYVLGLPTFRATRGRSETTDHPPIYPTGVVDPKKLRPDHGKIYELVVRRFFATLSPDAIGRARTAAVEIQGEPFEGRGHEILDPGWYRVYPYSHPEESPMPPLAPADVVRVNSLDLNEEQTKPPRRYTQGSLVQEMERLGLGTKSTRHDVIQKLLDRHYITARQLEPTGTGIAVTEALKAHAPVITQPEMTHRLEEDMGLVAESKKAQSEVLEESREMLREAYQLLARNARGVRETLQGALDRQHFVGPCPRCGAALRLARSPRGSRWVQCVNNPASCPVSFSLPAAGFIEPAPEFLCPTCRTPRVKITFRGQRPDLYCINPECAENHKAFRIGVCPESGHPLLIRYSFIGKRFVGCSGYPACRVTYPLPQRGKLEKEQPPCPTCRAPVVTAIEAGRPPWTLCINPNCPTRKSAAETKSAAPVRKAPARRRRAGPVAADRTAAPVGTAPGTAPKPAARRAVRRRRSVKSPRGAGDASEATPEGAAGG